MAKLNITMVFFLVLIVTSAYVVLSFAVEETEPKKLWDQCVVKIIVSVSCCQELVKKGKECYDTLIKYIADRPTLIANETKYLQKRDELWTQCVSVSKTI
ncbi:hypothetical protein EUTSA_v10005269mg [Eutrema salsugineum]|uniref:Prolamin-like domain-containing protein n=1 Tax=Eutrema salsugineum TaxID=72664 RepID=V4K3F5_EUTSA|nr:hypothetical protein EUTSA_v10005269mg [Eutrema salsugineum]